jgi:hypothetical protein
MTANGDEVETWGFEKVINGIVFKQHNVGIGLTLPEFIVDAIVADHTAATWAREAKDALEQARVDFRLVQRDSERDDDDYEYSRQDVYNDAVFALQRLDAVLARFPGGQ